METTNKKGKKMTTILSNNNGKLKKTSKLNNANIWAFDLPAYKTKTGKTVCPFAKDCIKYCFANKGTFRYPVVINKYENNYKLSKQSNFIQLIQNEIDCKKISHIRVHNSGDFYSKAYLNKWLKLASNNPDIIFYGYTKSIPLFKALKTVPVNFVFVYSTGSKVDHLINSETDRHARIFHSHKDLIKARYIDASQNDLIAIGENKKIGLIYH